MSKKYIVAIIFKNGMKLCSKTMSKVKAKVHYDLKRNEFYSSLGYYTPSFEFENSIFKTEDIFMITMVEEQKND